MRNIREKLSLLPYRHKNIKVQNLLKLLLDNLDNINIDELEQHLKDKYNAL